MEKADRILGVLPLSLDAQQSLSIVNDSGASAHVMVDVNGYFQ